MNKCMEMDLKELEQFHDGELSAEQRGKVASHLAECIHCARELELLKVLSQGIREAMGEAPAIGSLMGFETRVKARIDSEPDRGIMGWLRGWQRRSLTLRVGMVSGLALAVILCFMLMTPAGQQSLQFTKRTAETIESDGTIFVKKVPDSDVEIIYIFDVGA